MDHKARLDAYRNKPNIVPAVVYQTWHTKDFHPVWTEQFRIMKEMNKHIEFKIYSDEECREYIKNNFDKPVLWAYDSIGPTAFKADLWRYCVLYKEGGIYLDIKLLCYELDLLRKEEFLRVKDVSMGADRRSSIFTYENESYDKNEMFNGIWQAVMATKPNNPILKNMIDQIVFNVTIHYYGQNPLSITGPNALFNIDKEKPQNIPPFYLGKNSRDHDLITVMFDKYPIVFMIMGYREYSNHNYIKNDHHGSHYSTMWLDRSVYNSKHPKAFASNYIGYRGITHNMTSICSLGDGLFFTESFVKATPINYYKVNTPHLKTHISLYDNRSNTFSQLPTPESLIKNRIIGCMDPQVGDDSIITFNAYMNDSLFTVVIPGPENVKNRHTWTNLKGYYCLFCDNRGNKIAMHIRHPNIEFYKLNPRDYPIILENPITTIKINRFFNSVDWISNGMTIGNTVWFLMRRTKYNQIDNGVGNNYTISNAYSWLLMAADADKYNIKKISNAFTFNDSDYSKISNLTYDFRSKAITLTITSIDSLPKSYSYGLETIESGLNWNTF